MKVFNTSRRFFPWAERLLTEYAPDVFDTRIHKSTGRVSRLTWDNARVVASFEEFGNRVRFFGIDVHGKPLGGNFIYLNLSHFRDRKKLVDIAHGMAKWT